MHENELKNIKQGNKQLLTKSILEKSKDLYRIAYAITGNEEDSKDAVSSTILKVCEKIYTLKKPEFFKTWMTRILINECKNILRKRKKITYLNENVESVKINKEEDLISLDMKEAIKKLGNNFREIIVLYYYNDFSVKEISDILNISAGTVKSRLSRARDELKKYFNVKEGEI